MALTKSNNLTKNYVLVLVTLGLLALGNYYLLESVVASQASGAAEINIAGRQRMLSQRITLLSNQIQNLTDKQHIQIVSKKLADAIDLMRQSHLALVDGNKELGLSPASTDELKAMYFGPKSFVDTQVQAFLGYAEEYMNEHGTLGITVGDWHQFGNSETESLLHDLDAVVGQYQKESDAKVARLRNYQIVALAATLIFPCLSG